jgi:hypothetical protein
MEDDDEGVYSSEGSRAHTMSMMQLGDNNTGDFLNQSRNSSTKKTTTTTVRQSQSFKTNNFRASNALQSI